MNNTGTSNRLASNVLAILTLSLILGSSNTLACSCVGITLEGDFQGSDVVFAGKVLRIDEIEDERQVKWDEIEIRTVEVEFEVTNTWKGEDERDRTIVTEFYTSACGYPFEIGDSYVVFADTRKAMRLEDSGELEYLKTGWCSANEELDNTSQTEALIEKLEMLMSEMQEETTEEKEADIKEHEE